MLKIDADTFQDNGVHGDDEISIYSEVDGYVCALVADGITMSGHGGVASRFAKEAVVRAFRSAYELKDRSFNDFVANAWHALQIRPPEAPDAGAETTLTVVIVDLTEITVGDRQSVTAHYFALGDSPIIVCRQQPLAPGLSEHSFLAHQIHDGPIVVEEEGKLYSFLNASAGKICGVPSIGSFQLFEGDICLVMTDGIPFFPYIVRDVGEGSCFEFLNRVAREGARAGVKWFTKFVADEGLGDDGSMAILKCVRPTDEASLIDQSRAEVSRRATGSRRKRTDT